MEAFAEHDFRFKGLDGMVNAACVKQLLFIDFKLIIPDGTF